MGTQQGFTVTEVMIFLAISGLMLVGAIVGVTSNINNTRFNDGVRSTTSFVQGQYNEVSSGRNMRPDTAGCIGGQPSVAGPSEPAGMTDCVILGRFLYFSGDTVTSKYIVANGILLGHTTGTDTNVLNQLNPRVATDAIYQQQFPIPWSIGINKMTRDNAATGAQVNSLFIVRSPVSGKILVYAANSGAQPSQADVESFFNTSALNRSVYICLRDDTSRRTGYVNVGAGQGQELIQTDLTRTSGSCL